MLLLFGGVKAVLFVPFGLSYGDLLESVLSCEVKTGESFS